MNNSTNPDALIHDDSAHEVLAQPEDSSDSVDLLVEDEDELVLAEPAQPQAWQVEAEQVGARLDRYIVSKMPELSRTVVQQLISDGSVEVNGRTSKAGYLLRAKDDVRVLRAAPDSALKFVRPQNIPLDIVYEDDDLLVVNKAAGMVVHPAPGHSEDTLVNALVGRYPQMQGEEGNLRPGIVHRLDRDTSGLLIVAKNLSTQAALMDMMKRHEVTKRYQALVEGNVANERGSIDAPIGRNPRNRQQMTITASEGREARTHFRVLQRFNYHTLLLLQLETGRTHQIRVHLLAIRHPVLADPVYGSGRVRPGIQLKRPFLHAYQLEFVHPVTHEKLQFEAPLPPDLQAVLDHPDAL